MSRREGYVAASVGAIVGGVVLTIGLAWLGAVFAEHSGLTELDALGPVILGFLAGIWLGPVVGCWVGLRVRRHERAPATALTLAALMPPWLAIGVPAVGTAASVFPLPWFPGPLLAPATLGSILLWTGLAFGAPALLARLIVGRKTEARSPAVGRFRP